MGRRIFENDMIDGNQFYHVNCKGEVLISEIVRAERGEDCVSKTHSCPCGKDTYETYEKAKKALKQRHKDNKTIYKCNICGFYHLSSKNSEGKKKKRYDKRMRKYDIVYSEKDLQEKQEKIRMKNPNKWHRVKSSLA